MKNIVCLFGLFILLFGMTAFPVWGQVSPRFANYLYNPSMYNPGATGWDNNFKLFAYHRQEWLGLNEGNFSSQMLGLSSRPYGASQKLGLGAWLMRDKAHLIARTQVQFNGAYQLLDAADGPLRLGIGISFGFISQRLDYQDARFRNPDDLALFDDLQNASVFNFGGGALLEYVTGQSALRIHVATMHSGEDLEYRFQRVTVPFGFNRDLLAGASFLASVSEKVELEPALFLRQILGNSNLKSDVGIGLRGIFNQNYWAGIAYYTAPKSLNFSVGINLRGLGLVTSYETPTGNLASLGQSYELGLIFQLEKRPETEEQPEPEKTPEKEQPEVQKEEEKKEEIVAPPAPQPTANPPANSGFSGLSRLLSVLSPKPFQSQVEVEEAGPVTYIRYQYISYLANFVGVSEVENLVEHINEEVFETVREQGKKIKRVRLVSHISENKRILDIQTPIRYNLELGEIRQVEYRLNGEPAEMTVEAGNITLLQQEFLELYYLKQLFAGGASFLEGDEIQISVHYNQPKTKTAIEIEIE